MTEQNGNIKETLFSNISGLAQVSDQVIQRVTINGQPMETHPLTQLDYGDEDGNITVENFVDFISGHSSVADEFYGAFSAVVEEGHLIIEPREVGSKG